MDDNGFQIFVCREVLVGRVNKDGQGVVEVEGTVYCPCDSEVVNPAFCGVSGHETAVFVLLDADASHVGMFQGKEHRQLAPAVVDDENGFSVRSEGRVDGLEDASPRIFP